MIEHAADGSFHMTEEHVETMVLALCCLESLWRAHPDVVRKLAAAAGDPALADHAPRAAQLLAVMTKRK